MLHQLWRNNWAQDIAEYALMLAVLLIIVLVTFQAIGTNATTIFSEVVNQLEAVAK